MKNFTFSAFSSIFLFLFSFLSLNAQDWEAVGPDDRVDNFGISNGYGENATVEFDSNNTPFLSYTKRGTDLGFESADNSVTVKIFNGSDWVSLGNEAFTEAGTNYADLALNNSDTPYVAYVAGGLDDNFLAVRFFNGSSWEKLGSNVATGEISCATISILNGIPYVGYKDQRQGQRYVIKKYENNQWQTPTNEEFLSSDFTNYIDIKTSPDGSIYTSFTDFGRARVSKLVDGSWVDLQVPNTGSALGLTLAFDQQSNPFIAYGEGTQTEAFPNVQKFENGNWSFVGSPNFTNEGTQDIDIEIGDNGMPFVIYANVSNDQKTKGYRFNGNFWERIGGDVSFKTIAIGSGTKRVDLAINSNGVLFATNTTNTFTQGGGIFVKRFDTDKFVETNASLDQNGKLVISDTNGGDSDDEFVLSVNGDNLRIRNVDNSITITGNGTQQIDASTAEVPLANITNGIIIEGGAVNNTLSIATGIGLLGTGNDLTIRNTDVRVFNTGSGNLQLNGLNVYGADFDTNNLTTTVVTTANFFNDSGLVGIGTLSGVVNMNAGSTLDPGTSPGILTTGNLNLNEESAYTVEYESTAPTIKYDRVNVTGTVTIGDNVLFDLNGDFPNNATDELIIIDNDGTDPVVGTFDGLAEGAAINDDFVGTITYKGGDGNDVVLLGNSGTSSETEISFDENGRLIITDTNGGDSDDAFELSTNGDNLRIKNSAATLSSNATGSVQIDANTIEIPLANITNSVFFLAEGGNNTMSLGPELNLSGTGQFLVLNDLETRVADNASIEVAGLNINNGSFDINGATLPITFGEAGFFNAVLKGEGEIQGPVSLRGTSTVSPGTSPGILNTGNLILELGSIFDAEVKSQFPGTDHDQIKVTGTVAINNATLNLIGGYANAPTNVIILIDNDGSDPVTGTFADLEEGTAVNFGEFSGTISYVGGDGNDVVLLGNPIIDIEAPVITCPVQVTVSSEAEICGVRFPLESPTATDNVSEDEDITFEGIRNDGLQLNDVFPIGETIIRWTASDKAENISEACEQIIVVLDDVKPIVNCPANIIELSTNGSPLVLEIGQATASDNCENVLPIVGVRSDEKPLTDPYPVGTTSIVWQTVDGFGNVGQCTQTVTVNFNGSSSNSNDITKVSVSDQVGETEIDAIEKTVKLMVSVGTDLTSLAPSIMVSADATISPASGSIQNFTDSVVYRVTAQDGSVQDWTVKIEIAEDKEPLRIECPEDIIVNNDKGECGAIVEYVIVPTNNQANVTLVTSMESGSFFPVGTTEITATATDETGNTAECKFNVTVEDNEPPILDCSDSTVKLDADGTKTISEIDVWISLVENCDISDITVSPNSFTSDDIGDNEVVLTATDVFGNTSSCTATVTILPFENTGLLVNSFTLINADTDEPIKTLVQGDVIDIDDLPTLHLDIRANTTEDVESVRISLDGALSTSRTESLMPFALFQDLPVGDYRGADFVVGSYSVSATPYAEDALGGENGNSLTLNFELVDSTPPLSVTGFTLINADTDQPIRELVHGEIIDINSLPTTHLDIRANTTDDVESVRLSLTGPLSNERTESLLPYALFQDLPIGDYMGADFTVGQYVVSAIPYSGDALGGVVGEKFELYFELFDGDPTCAHFDLIFDFAQDPTTCGGSDGYATFELVVEGAKPVEFSWSHDPNLTNSSALNLSAGTYTITATDANDCTATFTFELYDPEGPDVLLEPFSNVEETDLPFELTRGMPEGGTYSGDGVTDGIFDPSIGIGTYEITYTYTDEKTGCSNAAIQKITVNSETQNKIVAFWLVDADTDKDLFILDDDMQIDISTLPTTNLDIRAETGLGTESVGFELSLTQNISRVENIPPYALFQDLPIGDYIGHQFDLGTYSLSGTPYTDNSLRGDSGTTLTIDFEFIDTTPTMAVTAFTLIDAETDEAIRPLFDGMVIALSDLPSLFLDIRADTTDDVESVRLEMKGQQSTARTESLEPYALFRDLPIGDYIGNNFEFGTYTIMATPYSGDNLSGTMGTPLTITFEIVDDLELNTLIISPNQATTLAKASFKKPTEIKQILIFDISGRLIESYNPDYIKSGDSYILDVNFYQQGTYFIKMVDNKGRPYQKQMVVERK